MGAIDRARELRRHQTEEEKELWRALKAGRFAGFKFRRQHPAGKYFLDFYCVSARLSVELDGFQHGLPEQIQRDQLKEEFLAQEGILELRFWNHQWRDNRDGLSYSSGRVGLEDGSMITALFSAVQSLPAASSPAPPNPAIVEARLARAGFVDAAGRVIH